MQNTKLKFVSIIIAFSLALPLQLMAQTNLNADVETKVREQFVDTPTMIDIAKCESGFRQFSSDGLPLYDPSHTYIGVFQISEAIHTPRATELGYDLTTVDGNLAYARYLYSVSGTRPWKGCANTTSNILPPTSNILTINLQKGMTNPQVKTAQQLLNQNGFTVALSGPGSQGSETNYFGTLTRAAVRKFQCDQGIACDGNESTTGFGRMGPRTRAALQQLNKI